MKKLCIYAVCTVFLSLLLFSCASSKKSRLRPMNITNTYTSTVNYYELANNDLCAGRYKNARSNLKLAYKSAVSIDESDLLCRISLSAITYRVSVPDSDLEDDEAFLNKSVAELLFDAKTFASRTDRVDFFMAACTIYEVRIELAYGGTDYAAYLAKLNAAEKTLSSEPFYQGHLNRTKGDVCILMKDFGNAERFFKKAAELHTKNRYLMEIGTDWYGVARSCSLSGRKVDAVSAISNALKYDKDAENTAAIAFDYYAYAKILLKGTVSDNDRATAKQYAAWSESIFRSGGFIDEADASAIFKESI